MAPTGMKVSPMGIALISIMICGSLYYVFVRNKPIAEGQVSLRALLIAGIDFAERGGEKVREVKEKNNMKEESKGETLEGANDPVTLGDRLSNQAMTLSFRASFPNVPLVSEEKDSKLESYIPAPAPTENSEVDAHAGRGDDIVNQEDVTIWVDPLDATQEYTENLLQYVTTMVCVAVKGRPVIGIIHKPFEGKTYWGWVGHGTNLEERKLASDGMHRIIVSRSHAGKVDVTAKKAFGKKANVVPAGGAGFKSLALFNGYASVYLHTSLIKKWDICAGNAILNQAGGKMTTLSGSAINYSFKSDPKNDAGLVAALHNHDEYLKQLGYS